MSKKPNISSSLIPQSNYRKQTNKDLQELNTTIPAIGNHPKTNEITTRIKTLIDTIHHVFFKSKPSTSTIQKKLTASLFKPCSTPMPKDIDDTWALIEPPILNTIKVHYLTKYIDQLINEYDKQVSFLVHKYKRHLPRHISNVEGDDLGTIAQLELIETLKAWQPEKNPDIWPLAYTRINGAMKDHIRYISKSDPTRFYDWVTDAASLYMAINDDNSYETKIENNTMLERALSELNDKEKRIVRLYINDDLTFSDIATQIKLSESQISRIYKNAVKKIKTICGDPNT
jgi:RNA polymerase sigma factor (sigma-70 family)